MIIADDAADVATVSVVASLPNASEGTPAVDGAFTFMLSNPSGAATTVTYTVTGTAVNGTDYTAITTTIDIPAGGTSVSLPIAVLNDIIFEGSETVIVTITGTTNSLGTVLYDTTPATVMIADDAADVATVSVVASLPNASEGTPAVDGAFTFTLSNPSGAATTVTYTVTGTAVNGTDYTAITTTIDIPAGGTSVSLPIAVLNDIIFEGSENVIVTITGTTNSLGTVLYDTTPATVMIADDAADVATVSVVASLPNASEGTPAVDGAFTFTLSNPSGAATTVTYTVTGTAVNGTDYTAITTTIDIPAGGTSVSLPIAVLNDIIFEGSENVIVTITGTTNSLGTVLYDTTPATVTIADDAADVATVSVVASLPNASEGTPAVDGAFTFTLSNPSGAATTVTYTVTGTAVNGTDYTAITTTIDIPAGGTSVSLPIAVLNDIIFEGSENVIVTITGTTNSLGTVLYDTTPATVVIADDAADVATVSVVASLATASEGAPTVDGAFTFALSNPSGAATTVTYTVTGTAVNGTDYTAITTTIDIPAGGTSVSLPIAVLNDIIFEGSENVIVTITGTTNFLGTVLYDTTPATVTISDDPADAATVSVTASIPNASEGTTVVNGEFTFALTNPSSAATTVTYTVTGTAINGTDYTTITNTINIPAGATSVTLPINVINDTIFEGAENVIVTITGTTNSLVTVAIDTTPATVAISDDPADAATVSVTASIANASEGTTVVNGEFTFALTNPSSTATTVTYTVTGTAINGTDYTTITNTINIPAGATSVSTTDKRCINDTIFEGC